MAKFIKLSNGVKMPTVGLGTWLVSSRHAILYIRYPWGKIIKMQLTFQSKPGEVENAVRIALDAGYRLIDTAAVYGNEESIGTVLKEFLDSGKIKREELFITTKVKFLLSNGTLTRIIFQVWSSHLRPEDIEGQIRESLKKLQLTYIDLYLAHMPAAFTVILPGLIVRRKFDAKNKKKFVQF